MNMPYEMFLTIQLMHLTCTKYHIQSATRKEGRDLFRRTSDDSLRNNPRMKNNMTNAGMWHCWATSLMQNIIAMKKYPRRNRRRVPGQEEWCLGYSIKTYKIQHVVDGNIVGYKARFVARGFSWKEGINYKETFAATGSEVTWQA